MHTPSIQEYYHTRQERYSQRKAQIRSFDLRDTLQTTQTTLKHKSSLLLLDILALSKQAITNHEAAINKTEMADCFYSMTRTNLDDLKVVEYRAARKIEHPIQIDGEGKTDSPDFIRFSVVTPHGERRVAREGREARILKEIIDIAAPHVIIDKR